MAKRTKSHEMEENTVSTEIAEETQETAENLPQDPTAVREMIERLRAERNRAAADRKKAENEAKALREHLKSLKSAKGEAKAAPKVAAKTLEEVAAHQAANPKRWTFQQIGLAVRQRTRAGQALPDAVEDVLGFYAEAVTAVIGNMMDNGVSLDDAINAWLLENAPDAYNVNVKHRRSGKSADSDESDDSEEA